VNDVALLPILEVLPWDPNNTNSLIEAAVRSDRLRKLYPDKVLSLEQARDLQMNVADSDSNKALFDFLFYSIAYHTFSGNVFSEARAKIGNKLCAIADSHADVFSGAFAALPEQFLNLIVNEVGSKYQIAYPACHMSNDMLETFQSLVGDNADTPAVVTFRHCLETSGSVAKCLGQDDTVQPSKGCQSLLCGTMPRSYALQEPLLASYDEKFEDVVATNDGKTVAIRTLSPTNCPKLRDVFEESQFLNWWLTQANSITKAPASCSSADWNRKIADSKALIKSAISCGNKLGLGYVPKLGDATRSIESFYDFRCNPRVSADLLSNGVEGVVQLGDGLEPTIGKLETYAELLGHQPLDAIIDAFEMMRKSKFAACGAWSTRQCFEEYQAKGDFSELAIRLSSIIDWNIFSEDQRDMVRSLTNLDNTIIDMAICDLLQDGEFARRTGFNRDEYCDSHELQAYRLFGSSDLGHSLGRPDGVDNAQRSYSYRLNRTDREYLIEFPIGDRAKSP